jgi:hypothetical protein
LFKTSAEEANKRQYITIVLGSHSSLWSPLTEHAQIPKESICH